MTELSGLREFLDNVVNAMRAKNEQNMLISAFTVGELSAGPARGSFVRITTRGDERDSQRLCGRRCIVLSSDQSGHVRVCCVLSDNSMSVLALPTHAVVSVPDADVPLLERQQLQLLADHMFRIMVKKLFLPSQQRFPLQVPAIPFGTIVTKRVSGTPSGALTGVVLIDCENAPNRFIVGWVGPVFCFEQLDVSDLAPVSLAERAMSVETKARLVQLQGWLLSKLHIGFGCKKVDGSDARAYFALPGVDAPPRSAVDSAVASTGSAKRAVDESVESTTGEEPASKPRTKRAKSSVSGANASDKKNNK